MQTLLIVEDEKMIRQGIKTMVQRSNVPIDRILECSDGTDALKILKENPVDVMFTDIRMQKMDGIELVRRVNEMEHKPFIVAISGYDDFNYAVEMLRNGVKEYILKPVEREKIAEVLKKLNSELDIKNNEQKKERELGIRQIRELVENRTLGNEERELIISKYDPYFYDCEYQMCIFSYDGEYDVGDCFFLEDISDGAVVVLRKRDVSTFLKNEMSDKCFGLGGVHKGLSEVATAYDEASLMRKLAFTRGKACVFGEAKPEHINEKIRERAFEFLSESERTKRVQIIGTDKTDDLIRYWKAFFTTLEREMLSVSEFSKEINENIDRILEVYKENLDEEDRKTAERCRKLKSFENLNEYQNSFTDWILDLNKRLGAGSDDVDIRKKIARAKQYIEENYAKDLNMAVVSNYVSMNYSLFSFSFKQYTGQNFVKYLKEIRIGKARKLLAESDMKIIEISQAVGYENEKNFMKIFKSLCGVTPGEYRKNMTSSRS